MILGARPGGHRPAPRPHTPPRPRRCGRSCAARRGTVRAPARSRWLARRAPPRRGPQATVPGDDPALRRSRSPTAGVATAWPRPAFAGTRPAWRSIRSEPRSVLVTGSTAAAVCVLLCGSTPMTIMENGFPSRACDGGIRGGQSDFKHLARTCGHASLQSRREREPEGSTHPRRVNPHAGDRNLRESGPPVRYGTLRAANPITNR